MVKTILIRSLVKNKANNQFSITLPKKEIIKLSMKGDPLKEPKKIKIKIKGLCW